MFFALITLGFYATFFADLEVCREVKRYIETV